VDPARIRGLLDQGLVVLDDAAPPDVRSLAALVCAQQEDVPCVRFHASRAAVMGSPAALAPLHWLTTHETSPRRREDAAAWIEILRSEAPAP
jgi:hypothetical protein